MGNNWAGIAEHHRHLLAPASGVRETGKATVRDSASARESEAAAVADARETAAANPTRPFVSDRTVVGFWWSDDLGPP
ncbi:hypothetical protein QJS10_CPB04g00541 [Acorus calamus]|uniref:Uncharacterized protein n=1 Tax=Acorus calamus TaxID=4465 RepID=A0AAV9F652_ACOCL|nr:hypothetical protein QJS10_CPB04g00541 [Acorus calamus]